MVSCALACVWLSARDLQRLYISCARSCSVVCRGYLVGLVRVRVWALLRVTRLQYSITITVQCTVLVHPNKTGNTLVLWSKCPPDLVLRYYQASGATGGSHPALTEPVQRVKRAIGTITLGAPKIGVLEDQRCSRK